MKLAAMLLAIGFSSCSFTKPPPEPADFENIRASSHIGWVEVKIDFMDRLLSFAEGCAQERINKLPPEAL